MAILFKARSVGMFEDLLMNHTLTFNNSMTYGEQVMKFYEEADELYDLVNRKKIYRDFTDFHIILQFIFREHCSVGRQLDFIS
jgi:hypothetical protein